MRYPRLLIPAILLACIAAGAVTAQGDDPSGMPNFAAMTNPKATEWKTPLLPIFESAAKKYDIPLPLLLTLGYFGSNFENRFGAPTIEYGYGVMALRQNKTGGDSLVAGASLMGASVEALQLDPALNISAAASVLDSYARDMKIDRAKGLEAWLEPVIKYAGLDKENSRFFAMEIYEKLLTGMDYKNSKGEWFYFPAQEIGAIDLSDLRPASGGDVGILSADYGPAIWDPAASCNYSAYYTAKDTVVIHTIEGTAAGARSWFKNCSADVSAHYVTSEAGGVWQCVDEDYRAWHVGCLNSRSIGIENEGYAGSSSHPRSLYDAAGLLTRDICNSWGIPKAHRSCAPGILGHNDANNCHCGGTHWDPGGGWDWGYFIGVVAGAPPTPTWSASYKAQSYPGSMVAGSTAVAWAEYTNTGTGHWTHGDTRLGTSSPQDRTSPFYNAGNWIGPNRPTDVDQTDVGQGGVGRFSFILKAPDTPGTYTEKYKLVQEGVTWFGSEITWTITVTAPKGNITGTVRSAAGGQVISGATVSVSGGPSTTTNASGVYSFTGVNAGNYTLTASKSGFNPVSGSVTVNADATTTKDFTLTPTDVTPPSAPTGLTATPVSPSQINLSWTASTDNVGVAGYRVYRGGVEIGATSSTSYNDNGLPANTSFGYFVKAYDAMNNLSAASSTVSATTFPGSIPIFEDGFANRNYWEDIVQLPMPGAYPPLLTTEKNHGTFAGANSLKTRTSADANQGCLIGHRFEPAYGAAKFETYFYDGSGVAYTTGFDGTTDGWASYPSAYASLSSAGGGQSGNCLAASDGGWTSGAYREFTSGFAAGESFSLSMWAKWPLPSGKTYGTAPRCFVRFFDGAGAEISTAYSANIATDNAWHQYSVSGTVPTGTARIWIGHWAVLNASQTYNYYADSVVFSTWTPGVVKNNSRQGLQVRCLDDAGGVKAIYYLGTYSAGGPSGSDENYSVGYYKVCGTGCTGWYWTYNVKPRSAGWHKLTLDFLPYTGTGDVKAYIDGALVGTLNRTPDTEVYGLNMVAYGYHYRVNQESWFDDVAMYATQPHPAPAMGTTQALGTGSIRWNFTDYSNNEIGFKLIDAANQIRATAGAITGMGFGGSMDETGLSPNTPYTRSIKAYNGSLDSFSSASATEWTLSAPPTIGSVTGDRVSGTWYNTADFAFTAVGGFGQGTVAGYRYAWNQLATYTFTGAEPVWDSGNLVCTAATEGEWYLHVQGLNGEGVPNGTLDLGPYRFDGTGPQNPTSATETGGALTGEWQSAVSDPAFTWTGASDALSGVGDYLVYIGPEEDATSDTVAIDAAYDPAAVETGTYYLRVCARDAAGNTASEWATLFTFKYDGSAPAAPTVTDDGAYTGDKDHLHAVWSASDPETDIAEYQYAVGTTVGGVDIVGWTTAGTSTEVVIGIPSPGMVEGTTYYISVKARNGVDAWSDPGSSDGIRVGEEYLTISAAKVLANDVPVTLSNKTISASFANSYYIQEIDRSSGILVMGPGPKAGSIVTVGGVMGVNGAGERAILDPVTSVVSIPESGGVPKALLLPIRELGGADLNAYTLGVTGGVCTNNIGLLVTIAGKVVAPEENQFFVNDGSANGPIKVIAYGVDLSSISEGDVVTVTGISSMELDGETRKPIIRVSGADGIAKKN